MKKIYLNFDKVSLVDDDDYPELIKFKWRFNTTGYATRTFRSLSMHRQIMKAKRGEYVDHIDKNKLNNQKSNLRLITNKENCWWSTPKKGFLTKGVSKVGNKWRAYMTIDGKQKFLGIHQTKLDAMKAYDKAIVDLRGKFGVTNKMLGNY